MKLRALTLAATALLVLTGPAMRLSAARVQSPAAPPAAIQPTAEVINKYCVTCHNTKLKTAGLTLDALDLTRVGDHADIWEKVATKLRTREMPPPGRPRPDAAAYSAATAALETSIDEAAAAHPNPGRI